MKNNRHQESTRTGMNGNADGGASVKAQGGELHGPGELPKAEVGGEEADGKSQMANGKAEEAGNVRDAETASLPRMADAGEVGDAGSASLPRMAGAGEIRDAETASLPQSAGAKLLDELEALVRSFVMLPNWGPEALALWIVHTHAFQLRDVTTYLGIESPEKRCGKTTLIGVLSELVNRPVVAANISPSAFFRVIEEMQPTLMIDEADTFLKGNEELRGILNAGYSRKTAYVMRVMPHNYAKPPGAVSGGAERALELENLNEQQEGSRLVTFSCWCPKVMAAIGKLPDTLADRCIVVRMQRKLITEQCKRLRELDGKELRERCQQFVSENASAIATAKPAIPQGMNDRAADIWEPLLALADLAGGAWPEKAREAAKGLTLATLESNPMGMLLFDMFAVFMLRDKERLFSGELAEGLLEMPEDRPWRQLVKAKTKLEIWIAHQLRKYGLRPKAMRIEERTGRGYVREEIRQLCQRYLSKNDMKITNGED